MPWIMRVHWLCAEEVMGKLCMLGYEVNLKGLLCSEPITESSCFWIACHLGKVWHVENSVAGHRAMEGSYYTWTDTDVYNGMVERVI